MLMMKIEDRGDSVGVLVVPWKVSEIRRRKRSSRSGEREVDVSDEMMKVVELVVNVEYHTHCHHQQ